MSILLNVELEICAVSRRECVWEVYNNELKTNVIRINREGDGGNIDRIITKEDSRVKE